VIDNSAQVVWWWLTAAMIAAAIFSGLRLWVLDRRDRVQRLRLEMFRGPVRAAGQSRASNWWERFGKQFAPIVGNDQQKLLKSLAAAGFKRKGSLASFIAIKVATAILFVILTWLLLEWRQLFSSSLIRLLLIGIGLVLGWRIPELVLNHLVRRRRARIEHGIPDALDLLVVCAEAGLSLNQAIEEISHQLRLSNKDVAEEFTMTSAEMRILPDFAQALDNMVERTGLQNLRGMVATLKQSLQFGTPLSESLRIVASEMRAEHHALMEARAARLPVLLALPMMAFILPCLFMIIGTPVVLRIIDAFKNVSFGGVR
jgi:tight adherence protein C